MRGVNKRKERMSLCGEPSGPWDESVKVEVSESGPQGQDRSLTHHSRLGWFPGGFGVGFQGWH